MAAKDPQTLANHTRFDPMFHFFLMPLAFAVFIWAVVHLVRHPGTEAGVMALAALLLPLSLLKTRLYSLKVQDRLIRLEERLRLASLAGSTELPELSEGQLVALRFASDAEMPALAQKAATGNLSSKQIKQAIQSWRPDHFRV